MSDWRVYFAEKIRRPLITGGMTRDDQVEEHLVYCLWRAMILAIRDEDWVACAGDQAAARERDRKESAASRIANDPEKIHYIHAALPGALAREWLYRKEMRKSP